MSKEYYLPEIETSKLEEVQASGDLSLYYDLLCQPLHAELYKRQDFSFFDELTEGQQLLISYDYIQNQVLQGGFIQLIQNGYVSLLANMPGWLNTIGEHEMAQVIDDALKAYVINRDVLDKDTSVEEFAMLYEQLPVFTDIDKRFEDHHEPTVVGLLQYATHHIHEFTKLKV